ncbi:carbohydrate porin [Acinetobacter sp. CE-15]|uniref:carbohydrate porin n=1 Tax=Acinetobacter sp. CE-15 TaxID=3425693 RepID=UPI003DA43FD2
MKLIQRTNSCLGGVIVFFSTMLLPPHTLGNEQIQVSANLFNLSMYSQESSIDDHFTNSAALILGTDIQLDTQSNDLGVLKAQYIFNGLNNDAQLNTSTNWFGGVGSYIGGAISPNDIASSQLSLLTWDKKWDEDKIYTAIGRTNLRRYFLYNNCQNLMICTDPIKIAMGSPPFTYGYWGGYLKYNLSDQLYFHTGVFEVNINDYLEKKKGLDFSFNDQLGYTQVYGVGYKDKQNKAEVFYFYNNSEYTNAFTKEKYRNTDGFNFRFNYDFKKNNIPEFYGAVSYITEKNQPYKNYWELGFNYKLNAPGNHVGMKVGQTELNNDFFQLTQQLNGNQNRKTSFLSFDGAVKYKQLTLRPFVQYIWNPDNYYRSNQGSFDSNIIVGLFTQLKIH